VTRPGLTCTVTASRLARRDRSNVFPIQTQSARCGGDAESVMSSHAFDWLPRTKSFTSRANAVMWRTLSNVPLPAHFTDATEASDMAHALARLP
jgi:hypothetical protein